MLIVVDEKQNRAVIRELISDAGFELEEADSGEEALRRSPGRLHLIRISF